MDGKLLCPGSQAGSFPWGYGLTAEALTDHEASAGTVAAMEIEDLMDGRLLS